MNGTQRASDLMVSITQFSTTLTLMLQMNLVPIISFYAHTSPATIFQACAEGRGNSNSNINILIHKNKPRSREFGLRPDCKGEITGQVPNSYWILFPYNLALICS